MFAILFCYMNLRHLAVFHAIAQSGSISGGAARLFLSQPAASRELGELERRLGLDLFDRIPRGVRLTEAGQLLYDYAKRIFALEQAAETALEELADLRRGRLAVGASSTIGMYVLPARVAEFRRRYPGIDLTLEVGNTRAVEEHLLEHRVALGFIEGPITSDACEVQLFTHDEIVAVAAADHPLAARNKVEPTELEHLPVVLREAGSGTRVIVKEALKAHGLGLAETLSMGSTESIKRAVIAGAGIAWLSELCIADELAAGTLIVLPVRGLHIKRPLHVMWLKDTRLTPATHAFLELLGLRRNLSGIAALHTDS